MVNNGGSAPDKAGALLKGFEYKASVDLVIIYNNGNSP